MSTLSRRLLAVAGAAFIGAVGTLAFAGPASAHHATVTAVVECAKEAGKVDVSWKVANSERDLDGEIAKVITPKDGFGKIVKGAKLPKGGSLEETQTLDVSAQQATLKLQVTWKRGSRKITDDAELTVPLSDKKCGGESQPQPPKGELAFTSNCDGTVVIKLTNKFDRKIVAQVSGEGGYKADVEVAKGATVEHTVPAANAKKVTVKLGDKQHPYVYEKPYGCGLPSVTTTSDCQNLIITVSNPADGKPVSATVKVGDKTQKLDVQPGKSVEHKIAGGGGLKAIVTVGDKVTEAVYTKPATCAATPGLPVTGANVGITAGVAVGLVGLGAGLFALARRRRVSFTA
jgi:hypothetical protein